MANKEKAFTLGTIDLRGCNRLVELLQRGTPLPGQMLALAVLSWRAGRYDRAQRLIEEGLTVRRTLGDPQGVTLAILRSGFAAATSARSP